ncbi:MAG: hypothetical protein IT174_10255 [Acidobacteria bacterium]|nr:hypothetical protein [Acidobacteriota bacterium]
MDKIKLYPLHLGNTKVPYGRFYGGDAWSGLRGIWRFVTAKDRYIIAPIYAFLIEHPRAAAQIMEKLNGWDQ